MPIDSLVAFSKTVKKLIVIEENDPLIENALKQEGIKVVVNDFEIESMPILIGKREYSDKIKGVLVEKASSSLMPLKKL